MYFQTLDDKSECVGVYTQGKLHFDEIPAGLTRTWRATGSIVDAAIEYAYLHAGGRRLEEVCPEDLKEDLLAAQKTFRAYLKAFKIGKISMRTHCFFDLVPESFLMEFCEIKNKITEHVFDTTERQPHYEMLDNIHRLLTTIKLRDLNLNTDDCRELQHSSRDRRLVNELVNHYKYIDYNLFGTVTGRLTTAQNSFPILTLKRAFRKLVKPHNDWFISLDYNGAEARTMLHLAGQEQPQTDIHEWNVENFFKSHRDRETAKTLFFAWLYNPDSSALKAECYNREKVLDEWYRGGYIYTPYERKILVDDRRALNYLIQSATSDRVLMRAVEIDKYLEGKKSFVSHIVHDEIVIDFSDEERDNMLEIKQIFEKDNFVANVNAGKNYAELEKLKL